MFGIKYYKADYSTYVIKTSSGRVMKTGKGENGVGQTVITGYNSNANGARNRDHFAWSKIYGTMGVDRLVNARGPQSGKLAPLQRASGWTPTISDVRYGAMVAGASEFQGQLVEAGLHLV